MISYTFLLISQTAKIKHLHLNISGFDLFIFIFYTRKKISTIIFILQEKIDYL